MSEIYTHNNDHTHVIITIASQLAVGLIIDQLLLKGKPADI